MKATINTIIILALTDLIIVLFIMLAIANGEDVIHVGFWDAQIRFIVNIIR